ncbi:ATP-binding response regulator [Polaribacter sp.]|uniref:ATP-binding response regulator n=1 Tax=Polaribacter sp. TaxID=1920175 RepID=UPI003F6AB266
MIPAKIEDVFLQVTTDFSGVITNIIAGNFAKSIFKKQEVIYKVCPFLEGTLEALSTAEPFLLEGMVIVEGTAEYNVDIELFKKDNFIEVLIHNRTNVYKIVDQLNQNRNDIFFIKRELAIKNEELKRLREIADKANEEKSRFLAIMSHEIRNPLNVILGYASLISEENTNNNLNEYVKYLQLSSKKLKVIVDDILDLSRIEAGKLKLLNAPISITEIVKSCIHNYTKQSSKKDILLQLDTANNVPNNLLGDDVRIHQILSNLISNAIKFTDQGSIILKVDCIAETEKKATIQFQIKDSGRGMSKEQAAKIFNEYQQNNLDDNRVFGGAGLGLSIVKRLLVAMEGEISVESILDKGTTFTMEIPFDKVLNLTENKPEDKATVIEKSLANCRILIADDDAMNQAIVAHILKKENAIITLVKDGLEALNTLINKSFDIVLLDIHMPNMTGEALVQLKKDFKNTNQKIPFLALTANTLQEDVKRYKKIGFKDVIAKPYTAEEFVQKIILNL